MRVLLGLRRRRRAQVLPLIETLKTVRAGSDVVAVTPSHDGYNWMGVNRATHALFPGRVIDLPDATPITRHEIDVLADGIAGLGFRQVIFSGIPSIFDRLARLLHSRGMTIGVLYHGAVSFCGFDDSLPRLLERLLALCREGVVRKLACNKKGLPETVHALTGIPAYRFMVPVDVPVLERISDPRSELWIGAMGHDIPRKNLHTQIAAALLVDGARVHVAGTPEVSYWPGHDRIVRHPVAAPHREYLNVLGQMDVNLHLSFSESWGQVTAESLALGVPCLIANHSDVLDYDPILRDALVSDHFDDPWELSRDIRRVLEMRVALEPRCRAYPAILNAKAETLLNAFLEA